MELATANAAGSSASGIDWFDIELPAQVDGQRIDVLPALRQVLARGGEAVLARGDDYLLPLPLGQGSFTAIALGKVRPLLESAAVPRNG